MVRHDLRPIDRFIAEAAGIEMPSAAARATSWRRLYPFLAASSMRASMRERSVDVILHSLP